VDLKDKSCIQECPVDCIYEGGRMLYINPDECVDCGACEPVCPPGAIAYEDDSAPWAIVRMSPRRRPGRSRPRRGLPPPITALRRAG
jgi:NAD-dependent dihydropyrimidine dehydrogenase PreA subunit